MFSVGGPSKAEVRVRGDVFGFRTRGVSWSVVGPVHAEGVRPRHRGMRGLAPVVRGQFSICISISISISIAIGTRPASASGISRGVPGNSLWGRVEPEVFGEV